LDVLETQQGDSSYESVPCGFIGDSWRVSFGRTWSVAFSLSAGVGVCDPYSGPRFDLSFLNLACGKARFDLDRCFKAKRTEIRLILPWKS